MIWLLLGYLAGFWTTARLLHVLDRRFDLFGDGGDEPIYISLFWPVALVGVVIATPFVILYRLATREYRSRRR